MARAIESFRVAGIGLKWPNDVMLKGGKLAGILVELVPGSHPMPAAVIGIGINLRLPKGFAAGRDFVPADLACAVEAPPSRNALLARLLTELEEVLTSFAAQGFTATREDWLARHVHQGVQLRLDTGREIVQGRCCGVDAEGALLLATDSGLRRVISGEVRPV